MFYNLFRIMVFRASDFPESPDRQSLHKRCISSPKIAPEGHRIFHKPCDCRNESTSYGPPFRFSKFMHSDVSFLEILITKTKSLLPSLRAGRLYTREVEASLREDSLRELPPFGKEGRPAWAKPLRRRQGEIFN